MDGKSLKTLRKAAGISQAKLASMLQCSKRTVERWETEQCGIKAATGEYIRILLANGNKKRPHR